VFVRGGESRCSDAIRGNPGTRPMTTHLRSRPWPSSSTP
jgi:hypothetical protein